MEGRDSLFDEIQSQVALVAESILRFIEKPTALPQENTLLKEIEVAFSDLTRLITINDATSGKVIAESVSEMEDFLKLMLRLMQEIITRKENEFPFEA